MTQEIHTTPTIYGDVPSYIIEKCASLKLAVFDVDGVFSDGSIYLGNNAEEYKAFNTKDGYGIKALVQSGVQVAVITGRTSKIVETRMKALKVKHLIQGREDKHAALLALMRSTGFKQEQIASMGDDMPDLGMFELSTLKVAVQDAHPFVKSKANFITTLGGGKGAVREFCDLVLLAKGVLHQQFGASV